VNKNGLLIGICSHGSTLERVLGARKGAADGRPFLYSKKYKTVSNKRIKQLEFQMKNNELHAQIATILELTRESVTLKGWNKKHDKILKGIVDDLMFVHNNYRVSFQSKKK
jgi:hypothetical protein